MSPIPTVFIPDLLCDEMLYTDVITALGDQIEAQVLSSPQPTFAASIMVWPAPPKRSCWSARPTAAIWPWIWP